jgi:hypothetical protein
VKRSAVCGGQQPVGATYAAVVPVDEARVHLNRRFKRDYPDENSMEWELMPETDSPGELSS